MKTLPLLVALPFILAACASTPPVVVTYTPQNLPQPAPVDATPKAPATPPPEVVYTAPSDTQEPQAVAPGDSQALVKNNTEEMTQGPTPRDFDGGPVSYPFVDGRMYRVFCSPNHQTNIVLEPGEQILGQPVTGDDKTFKLTNLIGKEGGQPVVNLFLIPKYAGKTTNVTILTDKRTYRFVFSSYVESYMPVVKFDYSYDSLTTIDGVPQSDGRSSSSPAGQDIYLYGKIENFDFNYAILARTPNKPAWAPTHVFTDGHSTYLQFASAKGAAYAPIFVVLDGNNRPVLTNFRVKGIFYIIDKVVEHGQILLNKNDGNIIDIVRLH